MVTADERKLVLARLENLPPHMKLSIGGDAAIPKQQLIEHVEKGDAIGNKFVEIQLLYLKNLAKVYG